MPSPAAAPAPAPETEGAQAQREPTPAPRAWLTVCALLALGSGLAWGLPAAWLDWQPQRAAAEPWRFVTAAWVHWSELHLAANLAGIAVLAVLGWVARLPVAAAWAWAAAWPLTQAGLLAQPALAHYGGASGVVHAAVAVAASWLVARGAGRVRAVGVAMGAGLVVKVLSEQPWLGPLAQPQGWDIATAPWAHASGAVAGLGAALFALLAASRVRPDGRVHDQAHR